MACDTPVVSSSGGALPEVLGDAALKGDPNDVRTLADSLATILFDESCRSEMIRRGRKRAAMYRWDRHAEEVLDAYQALRACQWEYA
jgi:glycosyltransferase involved in cell wall biosynthesis